MRFVQALEFVQANLDKILSQVGDKSGDRETVEGFLNVVFRLFQHVLDTCKGPPCPPREHIRASASSPRLHVMPAASVCQSYSYGRRILRAVTVEKIVIVVRVRRRRWPLTTVTIFSTVPVMF
jgi:hypothetical protein